MRDLVAALLLLASVLAAVVTVLGALWWLLRPRVDAYLFRLVATSERATQGCITRLEKVADKLDDLDGRVHSLERTRHAVDLDELVDLLELVQRYRPKPKGWPPPPDPKGTP